jgi:hypothetical protein
MTNIDLDDYVSLTFEFKNDSMKFYIADDERGLKWWPTKKTVNKLIKVLQDIESQMTDGTNSEPDEDEDEVTDEDIEEYEADEADWAMRLDDNVNEDE